MNVMKETKKMGKGARRGEVEDEEEGKKIDRR